MYRHILVAVDPDAPDSWRDALPVAQSLARCFAARLTLCTVVRDRDAGWEAEWSAIAYREMLDIARAKLATLAEQQLGLAAGVEIGIGSLRNGILDASRRIGADLIVMASHPPGAKDLILAANALQVARRAPCSVLLVRGGGEGPAA